MYNLTHSRAFSIHSSEDYIIFIPDGFTIGLHLFEELYSVPLANLLHWLGPSVVCSTREQPEAGDNYLDAAFVIQIIIKPT